MDRIGNVKGQGSVKEIGGVNEGTDRVVASERLKRCRGDAGGEAETRLSVKARLNLGEHLKPVLSRSLKDDRLGAIGLECVLISVAVIDRKPFGVARYVYDILLDVGPLVPNDTGVAVGVGRYLSDCRQGGQKGVSKSVPLAVCNESNLVKGAAVNRDERKGISAVGNDVVFSARDRSHRGDDSLHRIIVAFKIVSCKVRVNALEGDALRYENRTFTCRVLRPDGKDLGTARNVGVIAKTEGLL